MPVVQHEVAVPTQLSVLAETHACWLLSSRHACRPRSTSDRAHTAQPADAIAEAPGGALPVAAPCALCGGSAQLPHMNCANLDCNLLFLACSACKARRRALLMSSDARLGAGVI